jgi:hypothetical protein
MDEMGLGPCDKMEGWRDRGTHQKEVRKEEAFN